MNIGIIGIGIMGSSMAKSLAASEEEFVVHACSRNMEKVEALCREYPRIIPETNITKMAESCDYLIIAVKPADVETVIRSMGSFLTKDKVVISIAAGVTLERLKKMVSSHAEIQESQVKAVRVMPNNLMAIQEAASAISLSSALTQEEEKAVISMFEEFGLVKLVDEKLMDAVTGLSGSGPAFVYTFIEALTSGGIYGGLPKDIAYELAVQTVLGAAKMAKESSLPIEELRKGICSPGGTTIEGMRTLEKHGFRSAAMEAVIAATEKSKNC